MKKMIFGALALTLLAASCGGNSMTAEEIDAKAQALYDEALPQLEEQAATDCNDRMDQYVTMLKDSIAKANMQAIVPVMPTE